MAKLVIEIQLSEADGNMGVYFPEDVGYALVKVKNELFRMDEQLPNGRTPMFKRHWGMNILAPAGNIIGNAKVRRERGDEDGL